MRILLLLGLALATTAAAAQTRTLSTQTTDPGDADRLGNFEIQDLMSRFNAGEVVRHDARVGLVTAVARNGVRRVASDRNAPSLWSSVRNKTIVDWIAIDTDGMFLPTQTLRTPGQASGDTICWKCAAGGDGNIHCWQLECPVIVAPGGGGGDD